MVCRACNREIQHRFSYRQRFCSKGCAKTFYDSVTFKGNVLSYLSTGTAGAIAELLVSADLLEKEYEVFRSVSPSTSCDLIVQKEGVIKRVEVKTGRRNEKTGTISYPKPNKEKHDILAVVIGFEIIYNPVLEG